MVRNTGLKQNTFRVYKEFPKVFYLTKDKSVDYSFKFLSSKDFVLSGIGLFFSTGADVEVTVKVKDNYDEDTEVFHGQVKSFEIPKLKELWSFVNVNIRGTGSVFSVREICHRNAKTIQAKKKKNGEPIGDFKITHGNLIRNHAQIPEVAVLAS